MPNKELLTTSASAEASLPVLVTFDQLAGQRKLLQEFCTHHVPSLEFFVCKDEPIFKLQEDDNPEHFKHITSSATCYASIAECPDLFRPEKAIDSTDFESRAGQFATKAMELPIEKWISDGAAEIYCSCRGLPFVLSMIGSWHPNIDHHLGRIYYQLKAEPSRFAIGEAAKGRNKTQEKKRWYRPNAYHTYWALEILRILEAEKFQEAAKNSREFGQLVARREQMRMWARQQLGCQVALHSPPRSSVLDSDQLAWSLAILISQPRGYQSSLAEQDLVRQAFKCLFSTQEEVGTWRHYAPLFHYPHAGNAYCYVFESFAILLTQALRPEAEFVRRVLKEYFVQLIRLWEYAKTTQSEVRRAHFKGFAWSSGHRNQAALESWATASVFAYAQALRRLVGIWTREEALSSLNYRPSFATTEKAKEKLLERSDIWTREDLGERLWSMFINPLPSADEGGEVDPDEPLVRKDFPCSAIFFGPPGTSKTSIVGAIAGSIGWAYVELHPSHFVAEGLPNVQQTADLIFRKLMQLDHAVVLFDEIDELVRERDMESDQFGRFLTTSMLPRLAELWRARKVMYFVATNHIEYFDRAVTRSERFDAIVFISPPSLACKQREILRILRDTYGIVDASFAAEVTREAIEAKSPEEECTKAKNAQTRHQREDLLAEQLGRPYALAKLALLRWDELSELALHLAPIVRETKVIGNGQLELALWELADKRSRSVGDYCRFNSDRQYERFDISKKSVWRVKEIEGVTGTDSEPPIPIKRSKDGYIVETPVGPITSVTVPGYLVERVYRNGLLVPGEIQLRKNRTK